MLPHGAGSFYSADALARAGAALEDAGPLLQSLESYFKRMQKQRPSRTEVWDLKHVMEHAEQHSLCVIRLAAAVAERMTTPPASHALAEAVCLCIFNVDLPTDPALGLADVGTDSKGVADTARVMQPLVPRLPDRSAVL